MVRAWHVILSTLIVLAAGDAIAALDPGRNPSKECAICHLRWIADFTETAPEDLLIPPSEEKVEASERMCHSCHDGSVADSRFRVWQTDMHKTGAKPSARVQIPKEFPLDKNGGMQCATCHSAHGVDSQKDMGSTIFLREPNINSSLCRRCHVDKDNGVKHGQHPIGAKVDRVPRSLLEGGGKLGNGKEVICESCHTPHGSTGERLLVLDNPLAGGGTRSELCESCHTVTPRIGADADQRQHAHPVDVVLPESVVLPATWGNGTKPVLGEGRRIVCVTCHSPHKGTKGRHLLADARARDEFCGTCHADKNMVKDTAHDIARWWPKLKNAKGVAAGDGGTCGACHNMHDGSGPKMWARAIDNDSVDALCLSCHREDGPAKAHVTGDYSHPTGVAPKEGAPDALPLFAADGRKSKNGKVGCASCHDVHRWDPKGDGRGGKGVEGNGSNSFLRKAVDKQSSLCVACHQNNSNVVETKHDMNREGPAERNAVGKTVSESGVCGSCHAVHNAKAPNLWNRTLGNGKDMIERQCVSCHSRGHLADSKTTGVYSHPTGVNADRMAEGRLPLFFPTGERHRAGKVACATCHDVHNKTPVVASEDEDDSGIVRGSFLRIAYDDKASLCAACHPNNAKVVGSDHDLFATEVDTKNIKGDPPEKSGVCGSCHLTHNAWGSVLWGRKPGTGTTLNERQCRSCHDKDSVAKEAAVTAGNHPVGVPMKAPDQERSLRFTALGENKMKTLPLFDAEGRASDDGQVVCSSCHNVHVWSAAETPADAREGDSRSSFLRVPNDGRARLCGACHTDKALIDGTEHDMRTLAPEAKNLAGKTVGDSGICSACHVPHGAGADGLPLWARDLPQDDSLLAEKACLGCHRSGGVAGKKSVRHYQHPRSVPVTELVLPGEPGYVPLYDGAGKPSRAGKVACPTCHDAHKWRPDNPLPGSGRAEEGDARNSFLRMKSSDNLCKNCHGLEALERFKLFHRDSVRNSAGSKIKTNDD